MQRIKLITGLCLILILALVMPLTAYGAFESTAGGAVLIESSTGQLLYEKNADIALPPASITKIMTLTLGFEALEKGTIKWDDSVVISEAAWKMGGSKMFLEVGRKVTIGDLMTGISVVSANDGCIALAEHLYGSESAFVAVMNKRAAEIGLTSTHFENSTGLPSPGHKMSAKDIALLANYIINKYPRILELESQKEFTYNEIRQYNRNPLLGVFPGADGLKTGWTEEAGFCLAGTAKQNDMRLISVVLNTESEKARLTASQELLNYGFKNYQIVRATKVGEVIETIPVKDGKKLSVPVKIDEQLSVVVPILKKDDIEKVAVKTVSLKAPVTAGTAVGTLELQLDGKTLASTPLLVAEDVPKAGFFTRLFRSILGLFGKKS